MVVMDEDYPTVIGEKRRERTPDRTNARNRDRSPEDSGYQKLLAAQMAEISDSEDPRIG